MRLSLRYIGPCPFLLATLTLCGCGPAPEASPAPPAEQPPQACAAAISPQTTWDAYFMKASRVGYGRTTIRTVEEAGRRLMRTEAVSHLAVQRGADRTAQDITCTSVETPAGELLSFVSTVKMGPGVIATVGRVDGAHLELEMTTAGKTATTLLPWSPQWGGPFAPEQTLLRKPMQPGEQRTLKALMVGFNQAADIDMTALDYESTPLLGAIAKLLRIDTVTLFANGQKISSTVWTDRQGNTLKSYSPAMEMTTYRTTEAEATAQVDAVGPDLLTTTSVPLAQPLPNAQQTKKVCYRVHLTDSNPAEVFVTGATQAVKPLDPHTAEVTVYAIRPGVSGNPAAAADPPTAADRQPNSMIQSDDPTIVAEAKQAIGAETDPWRKALALERYVHDAIKTKDFSQAFATAAEVAKTHEGDCTEHAVYLAALARASGLPARVAIGLVYVPRQQLFGFHMWTEVYVDERWIPVDGTLALGGISAAYLKLGQSDLDGPAAYSALLPVMQVVGRLKIDVLEAE